MSKKTGDITGNKGEWSELYAFYKLLQDGKIYAADSNLNRLKDIFFPIIKIIREEGSNVFSYHPGKIISIYKDNKFLSTISLKDLLSQSNALFNKIFKGVKDTSQKRAFSVEDTIVSFLSKMCIKKIKAPSRNKIDLKMQIHDIHTGYNPEVGFSVKSDVGSPPTLLNSGKNTRIQYEVKGLSDTQIDELNKIDKSTSRNYMIQRVASLFTLSDEVSFVKIKNETFNDNLILIDSLLPKIYGEFVLLHYRNIAKGISDCDKLTDLLKDGNPIGYKNKHVYQYKIKKLLAASALGMTAGKTWNGIESATGGYIIVKKDGDVLCYHLYNRNFFEDYLFANTTVDRPDAKLKRCDYCHLYKDNGKTYIDFNIQIRFKSIK